MSHHLNMFTLFEVWYVINSMGYGFLSLVWSKQNVIGGTTNGLLHPMFG